MTATTAPPEPAASPSGTGPLANETIAVVEDSPVQRKLIARRFEESGATVVVAATGEEAVAAARTSRISLMVLDYELPDMSGGQVVARIAESGEVPPFVVTTARGSERVAVEMMKQGAIDYLIKDETLCDRLPVVAARLLKQLKLDRILKEIETALRRSEKRLRQIVDTNADAFVCVALDGSVLEWNRAAEDAFGLPRDHALGTSVLDTIVPEDRRDEVRHLIARSLADPASVPETARFETAAVDLGGVHRPVEISLTKNGDGREATISAFIRDLRPRRELEAQLVHSEKMASLGQLAAGVAHEINNPVAYVLSNVGTLGEYVGSFRQVLEAADRLVEEPTPAAADAYREARRAEGLDEILEDVDELMDDSKGGLVRVKEIVQDLKSFVRLDESDLKTIDINESIETTLKVVANELKYRCDVVRDFGDLPPLRCHAGQLNQVFMNLLVNAGQAIEDRGTVTVKTYVAGDDLCVSVSDTGCGIPAENVGKLFTPFFTTKPVGSGTGLGLSISYGIVTKHGGEIAVDSEVGRGTTFTVRLPKAGVSE